ncbi:hypothetical protein ACF06W_08510 [Streptomyces albus]|uniref:hypothetical protein n=1 Tax=Streptomyces albus TaxID=1888 RepID=UPI0036F62B3B
MSAHRARRAAAAVTLVLVTAALALTAGCADDDGAGHGGRQRSGATASAAPGQPPADGKDGKDGNGEDHSRERGADDEDAPKVPRSRLTPATGSFTAEQKDYLTGRVPEGMEPAAVLEAGETACARIRTTAEVSEKDAISALAAGEIDQAEPAIEHLCPQFAPLLKAAGPK